MNFFTHQKMRCSLLIFSFFMVVNSTLGQITTNLASSAEFCQGSSMSLSVVANNTTAYQWFKNGAAISGATTNSYSISSTVLGDAGQYFVVAYGLFGTDTSVKNTVSIRQLVNITSQPLSSQTLCEGGTLNLSVTATGYAPLSYVWKKGSTTVGTNATLTIASLASTDAGVYTVSVTGSPLCPTVTSSNATVIVQAKPIITIQPQTSQTLCEGNTLNLSVSATGAAPITYQWKKGGSAISGATSSSYSISNITQAAQAGVYTVEVKDNTVCSFVTSSNATVNVNLKPIIFTGPSGASPVCVGSSISLSVSTLNASSTQWLLNGTPVGTGIIYTKTATLADSGNYTVKAIANTACTDTTSSALNIKVQNKVQIVTQPVSLQTLCEGNAVVLSVAATGSAPLSYQWKKGSTNIGLNLSSIVVSNAASSTDSGNYTVQISDATVCSPVTSSNARVIVNAKPTITAGPSGIPPFCEGFSMTINAMVNNAANIIWFKNGTQVGTGASYSKIASASDSGSYTVKGEANAGCADTTSGAFVVSIKKPATITSQPTASQTLCEGNTINLSVTATGTGSLNYQWKRNGSPVGTNSNTYTKSNITQAADAGTYTVEITDGTGCPVVTSSNAVVNINLKPMISAGASGTTPLCEGNTLTLSSTISNASSIQWLKNGTSVQTGASSSFSKVVTVLDAGSYTVKAIANTGCVDTTSAAFTLVVNTPVNITLQPTASQTLCEGNTLSLTTNGTGTPVSFQWKKNGVNISGATSPSYSKSNINRLLDTGTYTVEITSPSPCPLVTSSNAVVNINLKPTISAGPSGVSPLCEGNTLTLNSIIANAAIIQWILNGSPVQTGSSQIYTKTATASDAGSYTVKAIANTGCIDTTSAPFSLTINTPLSITTQPTASQSLCEGNTLTLVVNTSGSGPSAVQWKRNGVNISGANSMTYLKSNVTRAADTGTYSVQLNGVAPCGNITSNNAVVMINTRPNLTVSANGSKNICLGDPIGINASASNLTSVEWRKGSTTLISGVGPAINYLKGSAANSDSGKYYFVAQGLAGCSNILLDSINVKINQPVVFTTQPVPTQTICEGSTLSIPVVATGEAPLTYVWKKNGIIIPGSLATYTKVGALRSSDTGTYMVEVTGAAVCPSVNSTTSSISINIKPSITAAASGTSPLCVGNTISLSGGAANMVGVEWRKGSTLLGTSSTYTKSSCLASDAGLYTFISKAMPGCTDTSSTFNLVVNTPPTITSQPRDTTICEGQVFSLGVSATGTGPFTYQWLKGSTVLAITSNSFVITNATQALAQGAYSVVISGTSPCTPLTSSIANVVVNKKPLPTTPTGVNNLCIGNPINLSASALNTSSVEWYRGTTLVGTGNSFSKSVSTSADAGNYSIKAKALTGCVDTSTASINVTLSTPATITTEPTATQTLCEGNTLNLSVGATGDGTLSYQWRKNGNNISLTSSSLSISNLSASDSGTYSVIVTNTGFCNSKDTSADAVIIVNKKPIVSAGISGTNNLCLGDPLTLNASAVNISSLELRRVSTSITTLMPYSVSVSDYKDSGDYMLVIKALAGCVDTTTAPFNVKINTPVAFATQPISSQTLCEGTSLMLSANTTGPVVSYLWKRNGTVIGSNQSSYSKSSVDRVVDTGKYTLTVTGASVCPSITSNESVVSIISKPTITQAPTTTSSLCLGSILTLNSGAINAARIDWYKDNVLVGTGNNYTVTNTTTSNSGVYKFIAIANAPCIDTASSNLTVSIANPIVITTQPLALQTVRLGETLRLSVVATSNLPLTYQWEKDGAILAGKTESQLVIPNCAISDFGNYKVALKNSSSCPGIVSNNATVVINLSPASSISTGEKLPVKIYPIPSSGELTVEVNEKSSKKLEITITDLTGRVVYERSSSEYKNTLDLNHLPSGVYHIMISRDNLETMEKFSIVK